MMLKSTLWALALSISTTQAVFQGFNSGADYTDGTHKVQADYEKEFSVAKSLPGTNGAFTSVRLFTSIQGGSQNSPTSAIPAAIKEDVTMLLGVWGSAGSETVNNEIAAIQAAIKQYGDDFTKRVAGISVGSEDLYRYSALGQAAKAGVGASPDTIAGYIKQVRSALQGTGLSSVQIGHVDTWTAWVDPTNQAVIDACDFIGMDAYPYFESTHPNSIENGKTLFFDAFYKTKAAAGGKPVWITETGWPVAGPTSGAGVPSVANAKAYWRAVGCAIFGKENAWWFILQDAKPAPPQGPTFGIVGADINSAPYFDLSCDGADTSEPSPSKDGNGTSTGTGSTPGSTGSSSSGSSNSSSTYSAGSPSASGTGSGSGTSSTGSPKAGAATMNSFFVPGMLGAVVAAAMAAL